MRILLADDHAILRSGLARILKEAFPDATIGQAGDREELRRAMAEGAWSLLLLDIAFGDTNGLELVPELKRAQPGLPIIVLSMYGERPFVLHALRAGVAGYLTKDRAPEELLVAVRSVLQGRRYLGEALAAQLADYVATGGSQTAIPHEALSARELEVMLLLAKALTVSQIADQLHLSVKTVSTYRGRILAKLGLESNAQIMRYALQHRLAT